MKVVFAILLTLIAWLVGIAIGHLIALAMAGLILVVFDNEPSPAWDDLFHATFAVTPTLTGLLAVGVALFFVIRWFKDQHGASDPRVCLTCGYDLKNNATGTCPECGGRIHTSQMKFLYKYHQDHA